MMIMENIYHDYSHSISQYLGKMVGSTGHPFSSMIGNVDLESLAIATQFLHHDDDQDDDDEEEDEEGQEDDHFRFAKNIPTIIFSPCKDTVRRLLRDFNAECQPVANSHCFNLRKKLVFCKLS